MGFSTRTIVAAACLLIGSVVQLFGQQPNVELPMAPLQDVGQDVTGAFEGWFQNPDGTFSLLVGYYNRNLKQELDIPIGPNNHIDPGGPDRGQPTHFLRTRGWGLFTIEVPKEFGDKQLTWTLVTNGRADVIPLSLNPLWEISPMHEQTMGNTPPFLAFSAEGPFVQGPRPLNTSMETTLANPLTLTVWVADDAKVLAGSKKNPPGAPVSVTWAEFRGPGTVTFANNKPPVEKADFKVPDGTKVSGKATTTATFSEAGDYVLHVVANDWSGNGGMGFQCCWTNAMVKVSVKPATSASR